MSEKHTPGPWKVETDQRDIRIAADSKVAPIAFLSRMYRADLPSASANARLISAAPDLLEALEDLTALYEASPGRDPAFVEKARAAIRKAVETNP